MSLPKSVSLLKDLLPLQIAYAIAGLAPCLTEINLNELGGDYHKIVCTESVALRQSKDFAARIGAAKTEEAANLMWKRRLIQLTEAGIAM